MPALVAGIHVFLAGLQQERRGWPGQARTSQDKPGQARTSQDKPGHDADFARLPELLNGRAAE
jgi:hypothetical protein